MTIQIESLTVHDANGQPYKLADAIFDIEAVRRLERENTKLREACHVFLEARKHADYGIEDAERAVRAAIG